MKFGAFTTVAGSAGEATSAEQHIGNIRQQTILAEELGFETMWLGEHHFGPYGVGRSTEFRFCWGQTWRRGHLGYGSARWRTLLRGGIRYASRKTLRSWTTCPAVALRLAWEGGYGRTRVHSFNRTRILEGTRRTGNCSGRRWRY